MRYALNLRDPGSTIGQYAIQEVIGYGGFGVVYKAIDRARPGHEVALKETFDPDSIRSFQSEFQLLHHLRHDNLPTYETMFETEGNGFLVMEYVAGQNLEDVLKRRQGPLLESQVLGYALQVCDALIYLHSQRQPLIHRDIKPANIRLTPDALVKLVDFGLTKAGSQQTQSSRRGLTPAYAPIEQWGIGAHGTDPRSDIYSLGATLYHLLTGKEPLPVTDRISGAHDTLPPMQPANPSLSAQVAVAVFKAMSIDPQQRYPDVAKFKQALRGSDPLRKASANSDSPLAARLSRGAGPVAAAPQPAPVTPPSAHPVVQPRPVAPAAAPMVSATIPLAPQSLQAIPNAPVIAPLARQSAGREPLIPGVNRLGWALAIISMLAWSMAFAYEPLDTFLLLTGWILTPLVTFYIARRKGMRSPMWVGIGILSGISVMFGPLVLIYVLINQPKHLPAAPRPAYRPRLCFMLGFIGLLLTTLLFLLGPGFLLLGMYLLAFIAEYIFVSKGRLPGIMLLLSAFIVTSPIAVLIAALTPAKRVPQLP
ncbi:MAG: serine/threonine protein kinase [Oscillochloridaceae bacterium umkhey_bin13]